MSGVEISRRKALLGASAAGAATMVSSRALAAATQTSPIETSLGKVRGVRADGVSKFLGIPYGANTATTRFMAPRPATPWAGVRDCLAFGASAPQGSLDFGGGSAGGKINPDVLRVMSTLFGSAGERPPADSEDCLVLNVWTPDASANRKRPVMFWLHGGGFAQGSGSSSNYEGSALCRRGDVVVVTINHRLNALGYLYLGEFDARFADSGNVGQFDQVLALRWVRDNIATFGGDPHNVTIFGESGGGAKVCTLLAMPSAKGLFHKAIIQSGPVLQAGRKDEAAALAERALAALEIKKGEAAKLQSLDYRQVIRAAQQAQPRSAPGAGLRSLSPIVDGRSLPRDPFDPDATPVSADIPIIIGTCKDEATLFTVFDPQFGKMTPEDVKARFTRIFGARADEAFALASRRRPDDPPTYWYTTMLTAMGTWGNSIKLAERKQAQGGAAAYMYRLDWQTPVMGGALRAPHGLDTSLVFDNAERGGGIVGPGPAPKRIAADMSQSWINFARTGDPSLEGGRPWPSYDPRTRQTMIFDLPSHVVSDPDADLRRFFSTEAGRRTRFMVTAIERT